MAKGEPQGHDPPLGVAVFGGSEAEPGDPVYEAAFTVAREIGRRGYPVVTGGYGGVMEAASRGAREAGAEAIGITCRLFRGRPANRWLSLEIEEPDLHARTARLVALARGFVVLSGASGTLAELAMLWALARARALDAPIVLLDEGWEKLAEMLRGMDRLDLSCRRMTRIARSPAEAVDAALREGDEAP